MPETIDRLAVALTCADWRLHHHEVRLNQQLCSVLGVKGVNLSAFPGPDGLAYPERNNELRIVAGWIGLHIKVHDPLKLAVVSHQQCAGHPVSDAEHERDTKLLAEALKRETGFSGPFLAIMALHHADLDWSLKVLETF